MIAPNYIDDQAKLNHASCWENYPVTSVGKIGSFPKLLVPFHRKIAKDGRQSCPCKECALLNCPNQALLFFCFKKINQYRRQSGAYISIHIAINNLKPSKVDTYRADKHKTCVEITFVRLDRKLNVNLHKEMSSVHCNLVEFLWDILHKVEQRLADIFANIDLVAIEPGLDVHHRNTSVNHAKVNIDAVDYL